MSVRTNSKALMHCYKAQVTRTSKAWGNPYASSVEVDMSLNACNLYHTDQYVTLVRSSQNTT